MKLFTVVPWTTFEAFHQFRALVEFVPSEANHEVAFLDVVTPNQPQCLPRIGTEFRLDTQPWGQFPQQRD